MGMIFTLEIDGRGIAAWKADTQDEAKACVEDLVFQADLRILESDGHVLWDGQSHLQVRRALPAEEAEWERSRARAVRDGELDRGDNEEWVVYLIPVADPADKAAEADVVA